MNVFKKLFALLRGRKSGAGQDGEDGFSYSTNGGLAYGGKGGKGGRGRGGKGGDAIATGKGSIAIGGKGGDAN